MSNSDKNSTRLRRANRARAQIRKLGVARLSVHRTPSHIYAQVFSAENRVLAAASTVETSLRKEFKHTGNVEAAEAVGKSIADKAKAAGVEHVAFDRSGFRYHGRVKALADAARENGLQF